MSEKPLFLGAATALITPFTKDGVDFTAMGRLIDWQIDEGIDALVVCGTTGEAPTLKDDEHQELIAFTVERVAGRVPVIAGVGSNDTEHAVMMAAFACEAGADGLLVVTPYYNKTTQRGLIRSYERIADASTKPIILYNVPSRTGVDIQPETYAALADHPMISGIKEANGNISRIVETMSLVGDRLDLYSGNDDQIVPIMAMGGKGVISVLSNVLPAKTAELCRRFREGDVAGSATMQKELFPLIKVLFSEVNPIPVKAAMAVMGFCENRVRLPLVEMSEGNRKGLLTELEKRKYFS